MSGPGVERFLGSIRLGNVGLLLRFRANCEQCRLQALQLTL